MKYNKELRQQKNAYHVKTSHVLWSGTNRYLRIIHNKSNLYIETNLSGIRNCSLDSCNIKKTKES